MTFIKKFFKKEELVIGLCGLKKQREYIKINIPDNYKKTLLVNTEQNFLLL